MDERNAPRSLAASKRRSRCPALLARPGARLTRRARTTRLGLDQRLATPPGLGCGARLAPTGIRKNPSGRAEDWCAVTAAPVYFPFPDGAACGGPKTAHPIRFAGTTIP